MNALHQNQLVALNQALDIAPGALGTVGNLRFSFQDGGTPRANRPRGCSWIRSLLTELKFFCCESEARRAVHADEMEVFKNSRRIGDLLGSLTAHWADEAGQRDVVKQLKKLSKRSQGNLANLEGGAYSLSAYMDELTARDIRALREGPLGFRETREAILDQISPGRLHAQAYLVLTQVERALEQREARDARNAMEQVFRRIAGTALEKMDWQTLRTDLEFVYKDKGRLQAYLSSLPKDHAMALYTKMTQMIMALRQQRKEALMDEKKETEIESKTRVSEFIDKTAGLAPLMLDIRWCFPLDEVLSPDDRSLNLEVVDVKVDEPSQV